MEYGVLLLFSNFGLTVVTPLKLVSDYEVLLTIGLYERVIIAMEGKSENSGLVCIDDEESSVAIVSSAIQSICHKDLYLEFLRI